MAYALVLVACASLARFPPQDPLPCTAEELQTLQSWADAIARGGDTTARVPGKGCRLLEMSRAALVGWTEARNLAVAGAAPDVLAPVMRVIEALEALKSQDLGLEVDYAQTAIRAAVAAAQEERPEMELLLTHARDLAERLASRGRRAEWPRPFNVLAGELWLEVDRYEDARLAFERAIQSDRTPAAEVGLARALARLGRHADACDAYRYVSIRTASTSLLEEARAYLEGCPKQ